MSGPERVEIVFDGRTLAARRGLSLAAALLEAGVRTVSTGAATGRPRGVYGIGAEEPGAFVRVESAVGAPMAAATEVAVEDGLRASGLAGFARLPAGQEEPAAVRRDKVWAHCDVCVVGGGPAGLAAARAAADAGARVILAGRGAEFGGGLTGAAAAIGGVPEREWRAGQAAALAAAAEVRLLRRTVVTGRYDHGELIALQRRPDAPAGGALERLWHIRAGAVVLATGGAERPIAFEGCDLPGVMLAGAAAGYARRFGVRPWRSAVVFGCHDEALWNAAELHDAGVRIAAVADARPEPGAAPAAALAERGIALHRGHGVLRARGGADGTLDAAVLAPVDPAGRACGDPVEVPCDLLAVSGGHDPVLDLAAHTGLRPRWSAARAAFLPAALPEGLHCAGAAAGTRAAEDAVAEGAAAGAAAAAGPEVPGGGAAPGPVAARTAHGAADGGAPPMALWATAGPDTDEAAVVVDLAREATLADVRAAVAAGRSSVEHVKRSTTIGTGPDQGRTSGVLLTGLLAAMLGRGMDEVGGTTRRPPYAPIPFAALAGRDTGEFLDPVRRTPMHAWHEAHGAVFEDVGQWKRPRYYPREGEDMGAAVLRECRAARSGAAVLDASTLGKIMVAGRDAGVFLDAMYTGMASTLKVGRCRYGIMCTADGMVFDDGVAVRLADDRYLITTTSGNADTVLAWLEEWAQTEWPHLCVQFTPVTDHWATVSLTGPRSREIMAGLAPRMDVSAAGFKFMTWRDGEVAGVPARVLRVGFTGELTFEINVAAHYGAAVWEAVQDAGLEHGITAYGTETMHVLRAEKGFIVVGHETDGSVTPLDAGMGWAVSTKKDFVGRRSLARADSARADRGQLVGLVPDDPRRVLAEGAQLVAASDAGAAPPVPMQGHVTSSYDSAALGRSFALALLRGGRDRHGERVLAVHLDEATPARVVDPVFYDKEGSRRDG
ncbi:sarcosine oxidase subunit alpha [Murinocardiopsis flavida]|uniref:Sarcosine oxidase subunit alpha n=1 Tax=Murinocardiopsis flavida TaxID=645275 RepID=A0A2P8DKR8_9ACTN|nr:2Fe-2S iron-sulfur cluster-binding protein [Murinocardiopsis flavida]PSK97816.1 sarcosine oxidase subunit alpha [Murinocardiopsis flavida]